MLGSNKTYYILSAELETKSFEENERRTFKLNRLLFDKQCNYSPVNGKYKGRTERSYIVEVTPDNADLLKGIAFTEFEQESIAIVDPLNRSRLQYRDGSLGPVCRLKFHKETPEKGDYSVILGKDTHTAFSF